MKKLMFIFSFILLLSSCSQEDETCYSCDSEIDAWVKARKTELITMNRKELSKLDIPTQQAALRMFSPERKKQLWTDKLNEVFQKNEFTAEELNHLTFVVTLIKNKDFAKVNTKNEDYKVFEWLKKGMEEFGWTKEFIYNSFFTYSYYKEDLKISEEVAIVDIGGADNCNCRWFCWGWWQECYSGGCDETSGGCGMIGSSDCTGDCS